MRKVLVVEDEILIRMTVIDALEEAGFVVIEAGTADEALDLIEDQTIHFPDARSAFGRRPRSGGGSQISRSWDYRRFRRLIRPSFRFGWRCVFRHSAVPSLQGTGSHMFEKR